MCAQSNFDLVVKVPLLIKAPWKAATSAGKKTACLVDLVDVGVTVAVLAGLPPPLDVDGKDVSALLDDPTAEPKQKQPGTNFTRCSRHAVFRRVRTPDF